MNGGPNWLMLIVMALVLAVFAGGAALVVLLWLRRKRVAPRGFDVVEQAPDREVVG